MNAADTTGRVRRKASPARRQQDRAGWLFVLPFVVIFVTMLIIPLAYSAYLSTFIDKLVGGLSFVGIENYVRAVTDPNFITGVGRTALFFVIQVPVMLVLALSLALALDSGRVKAAPLLRLLIFIPYAVPGVIATLMWGYLYGNNFGPIAQLFRAVGLPAPDLLSPQNALGSIANIVTWGFVGYNMIVMFAALRAVPAEIYEAAAIDGASPLRIAWSIKIPAILPTIRLTLIFSVIGSFQLFNEPNLLRGLAPDAITASYTPNMYAYALAFVNKEFNYAAAISVVLGVIIMTVSYVVQLSGQRKQMRS